MYSITITSSVSFYGYVTIKVLNSISDYDTNMEIVSFWHNVTFRKFNSFPHLKTIGRKNSFTNHVTIIEV